MSADYFLYRQAAVIRLQNPPVNGLSLATRRAVAEGLAQALRDPQVSLIFLTGAAKGFCGGADIREFNTPAATTSPSLPEVLQQLEAAHKPVIALIHGLAMGGGLELALSCHYRLAQASALLALPEVRLGLIPGAGGSQRLPRLIPYQLAAAMILSGQSYSAAQLANSGLFDKVFSENLSSEESLAQAYDWFDSVWQRSPALPLARQAEIKQPDSATVAQSDPGLYELVQNAEAQIRWHLTLPAKAPHAAWQALECGRKHGFAAGLAQERELFLQLLQGEESKALRALFFADRELAKSGLQQSEITQHATKFVTDWWQASLQAGAASGSVSLWQASLVQELHQQGYACPCLTGLVTASIEPVETAQFAIDAAAKRAQLDQGLIALAQQLHQQHPQFSAAMLDSLLVQVTGWPRHRGGPLSYAARLASQTVTV